MTSNASDIVCWALVMASRIVTLWNPETSGSVIYEKKSVGRATTLGQVEQ